MSIEGLKGLERLSIKVHLTENYIRRLLGEEFTGEEHDIVLNGPMLWENEQQAQFERDNQTLIDRMRIIKQNIHRILKD